MKNKTKFLTVMLILVVLCGALILSACNTTVTEITLNSDALTLEVDEEVTLNASIKPENASDKTVNWASSKPEFATVDKNGKVTAVKEGATVITATVDGKSAVCIITVVIKDLIYSEIKENDDVVAYSVTGTESNKKSIVIPSEHNGKPVTSIAKGALKNCTQLINLTIPFVGASIDGTENTHFGYIFGASSYSYNNDNVPSTLKNVVITGGKIDSRAFEGCGEIKSITLQDGVTDIGSLAFENCSNLENFTLPDTITSISSEAFKTCLKLQYNEYDNAQYLGNEINPYVALIKVKSQDIPNCKIKEDTKVIAEYAFFNCRHLLNIVLPDSVTDICAYAFYRCNALETATIYSGIKNIGNNAFNGCGDLNSIKFEGKTVQWNAVNKGTDWDFETGNYTVKCNDGDINK